LGRPSQISRGAAGERLIRSSTVLTLRLGRDISLQQGQQGSSRLLSITKVELKSLVVHNLPVTHGGFSLSAFEGSCRRVAVSAASHTLN